MKFTVLTLFPPLVETFFRSSVLAKAVGRGVVEFEVVDIRDFATDKHRSCDDTPFGGSAGMVLMPEPLGRALDSVRAQEKKTIYPTPSGIPLMQERARALADEEEIVLICGRYEGLDQRIIDVYVDEEISIGDYVISSGEVAAMVIIDSVYRLCEGVLSKRSLEEESFSNILLEYPHYTRPRMYKGREVPQVLLSGNHAEIRAWRLEKQKEKTLQYRPDLVDRWQRSREE